MVIISVPTDLVKPFFLSVFSFSQGTESLQPGQVRQIPDEGRFGLTFIVKANKL